MRIIVFGKLGQVGSSLMRLLDDKHELIGLDQQELDLVQTNQIASSILDNKPDWVINASAYTAVDKAETEPELADAINHLAPATMAAACAGLQCGFVHYSTDYVFDGNASTPYLESDKPEPKSVYGVTKLAGEQATREAYPQTIILRTAWVYAREGANFMNTMLRVAKEKDRLSVVNDQIGSPTLASDLARATISIVEQTPLSELTDVAGIYHVTGKGVASWYEFAAEIFSLTEMPVELEPIRTEDYPTPAPRPKYSVLSNAKLQAVFGVQLPDWKESLANTLTA